ncbi:hypothetical protein L1987_19530 [Smallanthus sonchifolius]|uniref:Uncharacterized protein n=1 Tax=Smallanthus sonchifolius TaxID=185202 RepID=A0ACB9IQ26_9ASTR|nr:hypothetical protein L1987_19530 [Smallanthus sonchifolius]
MEDKSMEKQKVKVKGSRVKNKTSESVANNTEKPKAKSKSKKVSFSGQVEVFPASEKQTAKGDGLVRAVYYRAHILFEWGEARSWTPEEIELLKKFHEEHGNNWKKLAEELGKHRFHVKDTWRRVKLENLKAGKWSQEEYQNLYDLVNLDLQIKINGEENRNSKHGMLRDNIPWTAISEKLTTRSDAICWMKWYNQLTSSLVAEKKWCDADDYRMIGALYEMDAACVEDVDWDNVLEHRPGDICLKRWNQMVKHIGDHGSKSFAEQVDILAKRYC